MPLIQCSPRVLLLRCQRFTPHHPFPASTLALPVRRSTALRAEPEPQPQPSTSTAEPPGTYDDSGDGPVEIRAPTLFSVDDNPTPLQVATSVMLTGAISVFLFRSLRRRARRAKELRVRSGGMKKPRNLSEEALEALRMVSTSPVETNKPPSPVQALLGGIAAGVIALFLYKFASTVEASLNRQTISDNFSVRQITVTIRTIINGLCYLATFVFGINGVGLILYSLQLTFNSLMDDDSSSSSVEKISEQSSTMASSSSSTSDSVSDSSDLQQISDKSKNSSE
ncbi:uncharacterized protein LOC119353933 [Triticum dicoccoides]|uniref:Uncharacterized protein n=2 Tax=Triticum TaxID=4564 RepID=A0A9R1NNX9_TRITD|nr:uncharacterized protein LOC119353933 [Triticum dicoccoides]VAH28364.1 unnamed protein product [Triticum turgidum subsp. durum]